MPENETPKHKREAVSTPHQALIGAIAVTLAGFLGPLILQKTGVQVDDAQLAGVISAGVTAVVGGLLAAVGKIARDKDFEMEEEQADPEKPSVNFFQRIMLKTVFKLFGLT